MKWPALGMGAHAYYKEERRGFLGGRWRQREEEEEIDKVAKFGRSTILERPTEPRNVLTAVIRKGL